MLKGLVFDMDGTMVDNSKLHIEAFRIFFERHGCLEPFSEEWFARRNEDILMHYIPDECRKFGWYALSEEKERIYRETFRDVIGPVKGLMPLIEKAFDEGISCCVGSSAPRQNVEFHLDMLGARKFMSSWLCMEDVRVGKPDPDIYLRCCRSMDCKPEECIVFEDASAGIEAGLRAGCKVVAIANFNDSVILEEAGAHIVVPDFSYLDLDGLRKLVQ